MSAVKSQLFTDYFLSIDNGPQEGRRFLLERRKEIVKVLGRSLYKEMILNYRAIWMNHQADKIVYRFKKSIVPKNKTHTSDIAIAWNIASHVPISEDEDRMIIEFLFNRLDSYFPDRMATVLASVTPSNISYNIKRALILSKAVEIFKTVDPHRHARIHKTQ